MVSFQSLRYSNVFAVFWRIFVHIFFKHDSGFPTQMFSRKLQMAKSNAYIEREVAAAGDASKETGFG